MALLMEMIQLMRARDVCAGLPPSRRLRHPRRWPPGLQPCHPPIGVRVARVFAPLLSSPLHSTPSFERECVSGTRVCSASARGLAYRAWRCARCLRASSGKRSTHEPMTETILFAPIRRTRLCQFYSQSRACATVRALLPGFRLRKRRPSPSTQSGTHSTHAINSIPAPWMYRNTRAHMCAQTILPSAAVEYPQGRFHSLFSGRESLSPHSPLPVTPTRAPLHSHPRTK